MSVSGGATACTKLQAVAPASGWLHQPVAFGQGPSVSLAVLICWALAWPHSGLLGGRLLARPPTHRLANRLVLLLRGRPPSARAQRARIAAQASPSRECPFVDYSNSLSRPIRTGRRLEQD